MDNLLTNLKRNECQAAGSSLLRTSIDALRLSDDQAYRTGVGEVPFQDRLARTLRCTPLFGLPRAGVMCAQHHLAVLLFLPPDTGHGRNLLHPLRDLAFVDIVDGLKLHPPRGFAHGQRRHRRDRIEGGTVHEH